MASPKKKTQDVSERRRTRRTFVRDSFNLFLVIPEVHGMARIYIQDISGGGLRFRTEMETNLKAGQVFEGRIYLNPGFYLPIHGRVVRAAGGEVAMEFSDANAAPAQAIVKLQAFFDAAEAAGVVES